ncbi:hypothetical protein BJX65DRAFT_311187 [Aspergillus insuetus]
MDCGAPVIMAAMRPYIADELDALTTEFEKIGSGFRILPKDLQEDLADQCSIAAWNFGESPKFEKSQLPDIRTMRKIYNLASRYFKNNHPESSWNNDVHSPILDWVLRDSPRADDISNQGRWKEAEELGLPVTTVLGSVLGREHPDRLASMAGLASIYKGQGRIEKAEELETHVLVMRKKVLGSSHPDVLSSMANLASTLWTQGRLGETEELDVQVIEARKIVLGPGHPGTLISMWNLAHTSEVQNRNAEAIGLLQHCVELLKEYLGPAHPNTIDATRDLKTWRQN